MQDPKTNYLNDTPFRSEGEYLEYLSVLLDLLIFRDPRERLKARELYSEGGEPVSAGEWADLFLDRLEITEAAGQEPVTERLLKKVDAPFYMRYLLAFLVRCALDNAFETQAAAQFGKQDLTLFDLCRLFAAPADREDAPAILDMLEEGRSALEILFPQLIMRERRTGQSLGGLMPLMDSRLLSVILGRGDETPLPSGMGRYVPEAGEGKAAEKTPEKEPPAREEGEKRAAETLLARRESMPAETAVLYGPEGSGKRDVVCALSDRTGQGLVFYEIPPAEPGEGDPNGQFPAGTLQERTLAELSLLRRECVLFDLQPVISGAGRLPQGTQKRLVSWLRDNMTPHTGTVFLLMETEEAPDYLDQCFFLPMEALRAPERIRLWKEALPESAGISPERLESLGNTFQLTKGQIRDAAAQALRLTGPGRPVAEELLYEVCYAKLGHPLRGHTQRVKSPFAWDDLKMNPAGKSMLRDLVNCVRYRHVVMQEWNFERKYPYGSGITALFAGPPGTGKTMAAQVIANELHMELYKIDLSQLMDKYVGETEKNIKRVFTEAGRSNSVLFFDEADAIFNKRLEAGSSNDRFANIETSLLLQCIEEFSGVTLLATNNMTAIDAAFIRRFRFYIQFWEPDEEIRYEIWSSVFPKEAPVDPEVDFRELARLFSFTGAVIKNVALQAAFLAAESGRSIGLLEIMVAVRRELQKNRRMLTEEDMGKFGYLFPKVTSWNSDI